MKTMHDMKNRGAYILTERNILNIFSTILTIIKAMKTIHFRATMLIVLIVFASNIHAQTQGVGINISGNPNYQGAVLDLSNHNTNEAAGFLPPYVNLTSATTLSPVLGTASQLSGLLVYNVNTSTSLGLSGPGLYFWNNTTSQWVYMGAAASANNGLSVNVSTVQLGSNNLIQTTNISNSGYALHVIGSSGAANFTSTGQVGFGNAAPNAEAIVDLTNTSNNWGLMLPDMTTANLPPITAAQNGLMVYNTSIGCPEIAVAGTWFVMGAAHGSQTFGYSGSIQPFSVPSCVATVTIVANGGDGGEGGEGGGNYFGGWGSGATVIASGVAVTAGQTLFVIVGAVGGEDGGAGGGGASCVLNPLSYTTPIVEAGGGGGGASGSDGADGGTTTTPTQSPYGNVGAGGTSGAGGTGGSGGYGGGGGGGWISAGTPISNTSNLGAGGGPAVGFSGGAGASSGGGAGGYGGGGGGGYYGSDIGGGGGGGGYNCGGGGNGGTSLSASYGGGGGGSSVGGANPISASNGWSGTGLVNQPEPGSVTIYW
jgi:hypothetical protein